MAYSVTTDEGRSRIFKCVEFHYEQLKPCRLLRTKLIRDYSGSRYTQDALKQPLALMLQAAEAHVLGIAANRPRVLVLSKKAEHAAFAEHYQTHLNNLLKEIRIEQTLWNIALDSFFGAAFAKVYLGDSPLVMNQGDIWADPGQVYVDRLSVDDFGYDTLAKDFRKCVIMFDRYKLPLELVKEDKTRFDPKLTKDLQSSVSVQNEGAEFISGKPTDPVTDGDYEPMIDLVDVYLPRERRIFTWAAREFPHLRNTRPLAEQEWDGAETGPYHYLNMGPVPDNILPTSPAQNLEWLADVCNSLARKSARQAQRQKTIPLAKNGRNDDVTKITKASDGEVTYVDDFEAVKELRLGGADNNLTSYLSGLMATFDRMAGNLKVRSGLGQTADTATQEGMIHANVTRSEASMQAKMIRFTTEVIEAIAPLLFNDPVKEMPGSLKIAGTSIEIPDPWKPSVYPGAREGEWTDYEYPIEPYSMPYQSPNQRATAIQNAVMYIANVAPGFAALQQLGVQPDIDELIHVLSEYQNVPELSRIFKTGRLPEVLDQMPQATMSSPGKPNGQYTRRNVSGGEDSMEASFAKMTPPEPQEEAA